MFLYTLTLLPLCAAPYFLGMADVFYLGGSLVLNVFFIVSAVRVLQEKEGYKSAKQMFGYSIFYLFGIFTLLMVGAV